MRYERLRQLRMEKGMTQTTLARSLSVSKAAISTYENGLRNPPDNTLVDMAHFFNVSVDYLLGFPTSDMLSKRRLPVMSLSRRKLSFSRFSICSADKKVSPRSNALFLLCARTE